MRPRFRSDLQCSREEQQGVVFYRADDPKSQTSFRLYEIEYLIAQKLDGKRSLADVIKAVKEEYNFDISEPDLQKFVSQLDSMGFVDKEGAAAPGAPGSGVPDRSSLPVESDAEVVEADLLEQPAAAADEAELRRLVKSALLHVRQGYIVHARDYFLAAKELDPTDSRLAKLVSHLEIIGDSSGPAEVDYLWNQSRELFPELAQEVGALAESAPGAPPAAHLRPDDEPGGGDDLRARVLWTALFVLLVVVGVGLLYYFARVTGFFEGAAQVRVTTLKAQRLPFYYEKPAASVRPGREAWLQLASAGKVGTVSVKPGERVQADQVLVALELPPPMEKQLAAARAAVKKAKGEYDKAAEKLAKLLEEREAVEAERGAADEKLEELKSKNLSTQAGASKRELDKWKKAKAKVNKKLSALARRERAPRAAEAKAKQKLEQARRKLEALEARGAQKQIRAPFAGVVVELAVQPGKPAAKGHQAVLLRDNLEARLEFLVDDAGSLAPGGEAFVSVSRGVPSRAKTAAVKPAEGGKRVEVVLVDPTGAFVEMDPKELRLVREFVDRAFEVPASAVVADPAGSRVLVTGAGDVELGAKSLEKRALAREVELLSRDAATALIRDKSGLLRDGESVIVTRVASEAGVDSIADGSVVEVQVD